MEKIIEKVVKGDIDKNVLMEYLIDDFDCEKIYDSDEELITDAFFTLKHYANVTLPAAATTLPSLKSHPMPRSPSSSAILAALAISLTVIAAPLAARA